MDLSFGNNVNNPSPPPPFPAPKETNVNEAFFSFLFDFTCFDKLACCVERSHVITTDFLLLVVFYH